MTQYPIIPWITAGFLSVIFFAFWKKQGIRDIPNHRSAHSKAIPTAAGICISSVFLLYQGAALLNIIPLKPAAWPFVLGILILTVIGFFDDWKELNYKARLLSHMVSVGLVMAGIPLSPGEFGLWFFIGVGLINTCNFLDGLNGLLASQWLLTVGFLLCAFADFNSMYFVLWISTLIYLFYNFPKAKVFIGDTGSTILGFTYFALIFELSQNIQGFPNFIIPHDGFIVFCLFPLAFAWNDVAFTIFRRVMQKRSLVSSFGDYGFHYKAKLFGNHTNVTLMYLVLNSLLTAAVTFLYFYHDYILTIACIYAIFQVLHWVAIYNLAGRK